MSQSVGNILRATFFLDEASTSVCIAPTSFLSLLELDGAVNVI